MRRTITKERGIFKPVEEAPFPSGAAIRVGTRGSQLARLQTRAVLDRLAPLLPGRSCDVCVIASPGDRDQALDLRESPPDFFTRDLDERLLDGTIDCAVHSAKDLPDPLRPGLDACWLPWREDPRDTLVCRRGQLLADLPPGMRIGVSSDRRADYCRRRFPEADIRPIRGDIPRRLAQLDAGEYDLLVVAGAALIRLGLADRAAAWIPVAELTPPDGQGVLALTFRADDARFLTLRSRFVKAVTFAAAGVGSAGTCTLATLQALARADVCLHDALLGRDLLAHIPPSVRLIDVGKRCGEQGSLQAWITAEIVRQACRGLRVVRLKGGDPGLFGRLAEETDALDARQLPYRVLPGVSSLTAATTPTGMLLTRRGETYGFTAMTPRRAGGGIGPVTADKRAEQPIVLFMAITAADDVTRQLLEVDRLPPDTPAAAVFGAGGDQTTVVTGSLADIAARVRAAATDDPGLLIIGRPAARRFGQWGALAGQRVLITASEALQEQAAGLVADFGGIPVCRPLIRLVPCDDAIDTLRDIDRYDWVVLTSPSAVCCFGELMRRAGIDLRRIRRLASCGAGTARELRRLGLTADVEPDGKFGTEGLLSALRPRLEPGDRLLRLGSDKADTTLAHGLRTDRVDVDECRLYRNEPISYERQPAFDMATFASASAVEAFDGLWGAGALAGKPVAAIGRPTLQALTAIGIDTAITGESATIEACLEALATHAVCRRMEGFLD